MLQKHLTLKKEWQNSFNAIYTTSSCPSQATYLPKGKLIYRHSNSVYIALIALVIFLFTNANPLYNQVNNYLEQAQTNNANYDLVNPNHALLHNVNTTSGHFIENKGQWSPNVLFMAEGKSLRTWITRNSMVLEQFEAQFEPTSDPFDRTPKEILAYAVALEFIAPSQVTADFENPAQLTYNYFIGQDKSKHQTGVQLFSEVKVNSIYEGIDMRYYFENGEVRYDFIVHPFADPNQIELEIKGSMANRIEAGNLIMETTMRPVVKKGLFAYQTSTATPHEKSSVTAEFQIIGNRLKFNLGAYDNTKKLVIDPIVSLTYVASEVITNSSGKEFITDIRINTLGNVLFCGTGNSSNFPDFDDNYGFYFSQYDIIVGEIDNTLNDRVWKTFIGGSGDEVATSIDVDNSYIYVSGLTFSTNYPLTSNPIQSTIVGTGATGILTVLSLNGANRYYSTYLKNAWGYGFGGPIGGRHRLQRVKVLNDTLYLAGCHAGSPYDEVRRITSQDRTPVISQISYLMALTPSGSELTLDYSILFNSLFGGDNNTWINAMDVDLDGNIFITGITNSLPAKFNITSGAYQTTKDSLYTNYVSKITFNGSQLQIAYNTYFGNQAFEQSEGPTSILYHNNKIYFGGFKHKLSTIPLMNPFKTVLNNSMGGFLSVIEPNGSSSQDLIYSSLFSGTNNNIQFRGYIQDLAYDPNCDVVMFVGTTNDPISEYVNHNDIASQFEYGDNMMLGAVDITQTGVNTLVDLNYQQSVGYAIDINHSPKRVYIAGKTPSSSNTNMAVHKYSMNFCIAEECECEYIDNSLLKLELLFGECEEGFCRIKHSLNVEGLPQGCFTHVGYSFKVNDVEQGGPVIVHFNEFDEEVLDLCLESGDEYEVFIYLYRHIEDGSPCLLTANIKCGCDCPDDINDWLVLTSEPGDSTCPDSTDCFISHELNIPQEYADCFEIIEYDYSIFGILQEQVEISINELHTKDLCVKAGYEYDVIIKLKRNSMDENPCVIEKGIYCEADADTSGLCIPDCDSDHWTKAEKTIKVPLWNCDSCILEITYYWRRGCSHLSMPYQDIQVHKLRLINNYQSSPSCCELATFNQQYQQAIYEIIKENEMEFEPEDINSIPHCNGQWRVTQSSCWTEWEQTFLIPDDPGNGGAASINLSESNKNKNLNEILNPIGVPYKRVIVKYTKPCYSDCCRTHLTVCKYPDPPPFGRIEITVESTIYSIDSCSIVNYNSPVGILDCQFTCDALEDIGGTFLNKTTENSEEILESFDTDDPNLLYLTFIVSHNSNTFTVLTDETNANSINISIYNLNGSLVDGLNSQLLKGQNTYEINISSYPSGTYIYVLSADGYPMKSDKFIIVR